MLLSWRATPAPLLPAKLTVEPFMAVWSPPSCCALTRLVRVSVTETVGAARALQGKGGGGGGAAGGRAGGRLAKERAAGIGGGGALCAAGARTGLGG